MAYFDTTWYVNFGDGATTGYYAVAKRPQNAAVAAGQIVRQFTTPTVGNERCFVCTVAGTTANTTDATWTLTRGAKTTDGTVTWQECTGTSAANGDLINTLTWAGFKALGIVGSVGSIIKRNNGASYQIINTQTSGGSSEPAFSDTAGVTTNDGAGQWISLGPVANFTGGQAPHARLGNVFGTNWFASGNTVYVGDNHAETQASSVSMSPISALMARILCHNHSGSYPPAASDITTGAVIAPTGTVSITFSGQGSFYFYGIEFRSGTTGASSILVSPTSVGQTQNWYCFDNCSMWTCNAGTIQLGAASTAWGIIILNNTTIKFTGVTANITPYFCSLTWQNTGQILAAGSSVPTTLFQFPNSSGRFANIVLKGLDLSQLTGSLFSNVNSSIGSLVVQDCKLNAAMTVTTPINNGMNVQLIRSASDATAYKSTRVAYEGTETTETSIVRTGGAVDPTGQAQSRKLVTTANAQWLRPFKAEPMAIYNDVVGSPVTVTVCGTVNSGALPNNDDIWGEFEYLGSATDPLGTIVTTTKSSVLASNAAVALDSSVWNGTDKGCFEVETLSNTTLSNGNLTVIHTNTTVAGARLTNYQTTGKYYFEVTVTTSTGFSDMVGVISSTATFYSVSSSVDRTTLGMGSGAWFSNNSSGSTAIGAPANGDIIGVAIDLINRKAWFRKNGGAWSGNPVGAADPVAGINGITIEAGALFAPVIYFGGASTAANDTMTANFGATAYQTAAPSGFGDWPANWTPFKLASTITPQLPGYIHARVRAAKISATYYIDPKITLETQAENILDYGATPDAEWAMTTLNITSGTNTLTASDAIWAPGDVGKSIVLPPPPFGSPHWTTIAGYTSATSITLTHNATSTLTAYDAIVAWGTDSTAAFQDFKDDWQGEEVVLEIPAGTYLISSGNFEGLWNGIRTITVNAYGATVCGGTFTVSASAQYEAPGHTARTASVTAGATSVTLLTPAETSRFAVGDYAMMTGQDMMHYGYPVNHALFEYLLITAINPGTGVITFATPLVYSYLSTWPVYNSGGTDYGGPATLYAMNPAFKHTSVVNGLTIAHHGQIGTGGLDMTFNDCVFEGIAGAFPSMGKSITYNNCSAPDATMEVDKLVTNFTMTGCLWGGVNMQSTAIDLFTLDDTEIIFTLLGSARKTVIRNGCDIAHFFPGPGFFGYARELEVSDSVISELGQMGGSYIKGGNSSNNGLHNDYTMTGGVITVPSSMRTTGMAMWAIVGETAFFVDTLVGTLGSFTVTAVEEGPSSSILVHTDWALGTFPARTMPSAQGLFIQRHPARACTFTNVTGCAEVVDLSSAPPALPMCSWTRRTYTGSTAAGAYGVMWGRFKYIKVTVTTPYTGATGTVTVTLGNSNNGGIKVSDSTATTAWLPVINLKTAGVRIFDATAGTYPVSWTGAQTGDTLPAMTEALWCGGNFVMNMTDVSAQSPAVWPLFTIEFITDQGF